ncbi:MAG: DegV family EDD domain-containing protein [Lachnospiraceae bacterium]|nr:DegV family EDD domain-containing protein [Lachnospiraceae bacterium]
MDNKDNRKINTSKKSNIVVLGAFTIAAVILMVEIFVRGWEKSAIPVVIIALVFSWYLNIMQKYSLEQRTILYSGFLMLSFLFYGIHQKSLDELTASIIVIFLVLLITRIRWLIWMAVFMYFITMFYDVIKEGNHWKEIYSISLLQLAFQFVLVILAASIAHIIINERNREKRRFSRENMETEVHREQAREQIRIISREIGKLTKDANGELLLLKNDIKTSCPDYENAKEMDYLMVLQRRLEEEVTDLKDFSDMLSGKTVRKEEVYEIRDILAQFKQERRMHDFSRLPELVIDVDPMIPKSMVGDREKLLKVIKHLVSNGLKYTHDGGVQLKIYTHSHDGDFNLCIEVNDTGIGIEQEDLERLLEQINERRPASYRPGGMGLGLFLVSGFVRCMGGFFRIESEWGKGTNVCISIPQKVSDAAPCMSFDKRKGICLVYEEREYSNAVLNAYYEDLYRDFSGKLGIPAYSVKSHEELKSLTEAYKKVCLLVPSDHYEENSDYYEQLEDVYLTILTNGDYSLSENSKAHLFCKPISTMALLHITEDAQKTIDRRRGHLDKEEQIAEDGILAESLTDRDVRLHGGRKVMICTDSMSDLSPEISRSRGIPVISFRIFTEHASFMDGVEISQECALEHIKIDPGMHSMAPEEEDFEAFFKNNLKYADHIIYISTAKRVSVAYDRAKRVAERMENVTVFNSGQVSGGVALMVAKANEKAQNGSSVEEIIKYLEMIRPKIKTSFLIDNLDYLAYVGRVSKWIGVISRTLMFHPVMVMRHDALVVGGVKLGNMNFAKESYIRGILRGKKRIDKKVAFVGYVGLKQNELTGLEEELLLEGDFNKVVIRSASAAISLNCGVGTFGIIYLEK